MMHPEGATSIGMAMVSGVAAAVVQANPMPNVPNFAVPIVSAIVGGLMSFAVLKTTVRVVERDLREMKDDVKDIGKRVARIEGQLKAME
jgi:tetrahydromethanopterin S-methyltransferase subunit C